MIQYILFLLGIFLLVKGANYLINGASSLAAKMKIPTLIIGLTVVSLGTTSPELFVNIIAAIKGTTEIGFGNIIGANMTTILLVLGVTALIYPIKVERSAIWKEIPVALLAVIVLFIVSNYLLIDKININSITRVSGLLMLCFFAIFIYYSIEVFKQNKKKLEKRKIGVKQNSNLAIAAMIIGGIIGLFIGARLTVDGAVFTAQQLGLSQFLISATIISIGTSLPELVTGITAARKHETGIVVGNVAGATIFNIFWILGITSLITPITIPSFINTDIIMMGIATILLLVLIFIGRKMEIERWQGALLILLYIAYIIFIIIRG